MLGLTMQLLAGPGWWTVTAGLAVLLAEYFWARHLLARTQGSLAEPTDAAVSGWRRPLAIAVPAVAVVLLAAVILAAGRGDLRASPAAALLVTGLVLLTASYVSLRAIRGQDTTHTGVTFARRRTTARHAAGKERRL